MLNFLQLTMVKKKLCLPWFLEIFDCMYDISLFLFCMVIYFIGDLIFCLSIKSIVHGM